MKWQYSGGGQKSEGELQRLVETVIQADDFDKSHFTDYSVKRELKALDEHNTPVGIFSVKDGWKSGSVKIRLPKEDTMYASESHAPEFEVHGIWYRSLISIIKSADEDTTQKHFHNIPFKLFRRASSDTELEDLPSGDSDSERVWADLYTSDALLEEQEKIDALPRNPEDDETVEYVIAPIMGYSDSTHLTSFGTAYLWPFYTWIGALSKYMRAKPSNFAAHHTAYIPKLPQLIQDFYHKTYGTAATLNIMRFCRSELMQKVWDLLLDTEFMHAFKHGILVTCADGIRRRLFPRFLTYSADYPERVALTCIRFLGRCPCPTCLVEKKNIALMGSKRNSAGSRKSRVDDESTQGLIARARSWIFERGYRLTSKMVERILKPLSLLPTRFMGSQACRGSCSQGDVQ
ncbi:hypothetical protein BDY19DRAFT_886661 [Irpex rosettiformis]|uniref:Uncharacterized protein n=1 Tax=Irpex rosettiformis TaxID=378272 RepID=A0ACB8U9L8_9APHY|nr:hypothetical protein BDY19DRAFT_886661 [Irpex rosettiformis]